MHNFYYWRVQRKNKDKVKIFLITINFEIIIIKDNK